MRHKISVISFKGFTREGLVGFSWPASLDTTKDFIKENGYAYVAILQAVEVVIDAATENLKQQRITIGVGQTRVAGAV